MRPIVKIATEGLEKSLRTHLEGCLEDGPMAESEVLEESLRFFSPNIPAMGTSLMRSYKLQYGRKIGKTTAQSNIKTNLRLLLSKVKKGFLSTEKQVIVGGNRFGRIFYRKGAEGKIQLKVRELIEKGGGNPLELLNSVKRGPVKMNPKVRRAFELLLYYGFVESKKIGSVLYITEIGYNPVKFKGEKTSEKFPTHFRTWKPFKIETWVLQDGPTKVSLKFDLAGWDTVNKIFYVGLDSEYIGLSALKGFREKQVILGLPSKAVVFCKEISDGGEKYAKKWGIEIRT
ncbi:MAG: hypothetical protein GOV01_01470 [Candidatus Altiarchaeota archaeon]|nr:hypothetical protein [Candidatus Altiarchaeota archaeon]